MEIQKKYMRERVELTYQLDPNLKKENDFATVKKNVLFALRDEVTTLSLNRVNDGQVVAVCRYFQNRIKDHRSPQGCLKEYSCSQVVSSFEEVKRIQKIIKEISGETGFFRVGCTEVKGSPPSWVLSLVIDSRK